MTSSCRDLWDTFVVWFVITSLEQMAWCRAAHGYQMQRTDTWSTAKCNEISSVILNDDIRSSNIVRKNHWYLEKSKLNTQSETCLLVAHYRYVPGNLHTQWWQKSRRIYLQDRDLKGKNNDETHLRHMHLKTIYQKIDNDRCPNLFKHFIWTYWHEANLSDWLSALIIQCFVCRWTLE